MPVDVMSEDPPVPPSESPAAQDALPTHDATENTIASVEHEVASPAEHLPETTVEESRVDEVVAPAEIESVSHETTQEEQPAIAAPPVAPETTKKWFVVKVQSNREESIKAAIERKVKIEGLEEFYDQIAIPAEEYVEKKKVKVKVKDKKTGNVESVYQEKNVVKYRKKFPGYIFAHVDFNDRILYLFRETSGVGDFVGGAGPLKPPPPMTDREVQQMLTGTTGPDDGRGKKVAVKLDYEKGDKVRIKDGAFSGSEAEVKAIAMPKDPTDTPKVTVVVTIWGRPVEMELDYWHVDKI